MQALRVLCSVCVCVGGGGGGGGGNDLFQTKVLCTCCWKYHINLMKRAEWFSGEENGFLFAKE